MSCQGCKFWSDLVARAEGFAEPVEALCLNYKSKHYKKFVRLGCREKIFGPAIDRVSSEEEEDSVNIVYESDQNED